MLNRFYIVCIAFLIDLLIGDPKWIPHPVVLMGKCISLCEGVVRKAPVSHRIGGFLIVSVNVFLSLAFSLSIRHLTYAYDARLGFAAECLMLSQMFAARGLRTASMKVYRALEERDFLLAREHLSQIVGRDTQRLEEEGIVKATIETVAENYSDGVFAPIFFAMLGGCPGAYLYKAVNTMDSMIGYRDEKYLEIGRYAAKLDDLMNYIPSRIAAFTLLIAGFLKGLDYRNGMRIFSRDRYRHASPNAGQTESVAAGLLGVELGGDAYYFGRLCHKETIGDAKRSANKEDIKRINDVMYLASFLGLLLCWFAVEEIREIREILKN